MVSGAVQAGAQIFIVFEQLDRQPARFELLAQDRIGFDVRAQRRDLVFEQIAIIHLHGRHRSGNAVAQL